MSSLSTISFGKRCSRSFLSILLNCRLEQFPARVLRCLYLARRLWRSPFAVQVAFYRVTPCLSTKDGCSVGDPVDLGRWALKAVSSQITAHTPTDVHATRQVCRTAEKTSGKKTTRQKTILVTFMQTRDMYLHFTRSNIWANGNN